MQTSEHHLGGKPDKHDARDKPYVPAIASPPASASVAPLVNSVYNQFPMKMSCSANAIAASFEMVAKIEKRTISAPSRLFLYYNARVRDGSPDKDDGATIRDAIKAAANPGTCAETLWPYDPAQVCAKPSDQAYANTAECVASYFRMNQDINTMKSCIAEGFPFIFGMAVFGSLLVAAEKSGRYDLPSDATTQPDGGHAVVAVGYDDTTFTVLNSFGPAWGSNGYFTMPYAYFTNSNWTYDFWTIRSLR
jgi:C1A family cysteine protease